MLPIYAILLYLSQIFVGGSYNQPQMNEIISQNQRQIDQIQTNTILMDQIHQQYDQGANIIVEDNHELLP
jgi:hypothetical protein